jgi:hypothetical protein
VWNLKKRSVDGQFAVKCKAETYCWPQLRTQKLNKVLYKEDYGVDK